MRLWSLHPKHLDKSGLIACWREGLLAFSVLKRIAKGEAKIGYRNHSQLVRFKQQSDPILYVSDYLHHIVDEAQQRGYNYKRSKLLPYDGSLTMTVTAGQIVLEYQHLASKLITRSPDQGKKLLSIPSPDLHPMFKMIEGKVEDWEKI